MRYECGAMIAATLGVATITGAQAPFDLDPSFVTTIGTQGVGSIAVLEDGDILLSGSIKFPGDDYARSTARLNPNGSRDLTYPQVTYGGGKLVPWNSRFYVANGQGIRRIWSDGTTDTDFQGLELDPYIHILQGGDYHVFPDGRLLITGTHELSDTARGFNGLYNLIWITPEGRLDTTRIHRKANGDITTLQVLSDGRFIAAGGMSVYDGHDVGGIIRIEPDGSLDTTFVSSLEWFYPFTFRPLPDGKILCGGVMRFAGIADTLNLVRLLPDGQIDPTFNNGIDYKATWNTADIGSVSLITPLGTDRYITTGYFDRIDGQPRGGIALLDSAGNLLDDLFDTGGCGTYWTGSATVGGIVGLVPAPDGKYYIHGSYHGYDDGTTNDEDQRMVSRLYGMDVGVREQAVIGTQLQLSPNPATDRVQVFWSGTDALREVRVKDMTGREVLRRKLNSLDPHALDVTSLPAGVYSVCAVDGTMLLGAAKLIIE